MNPYELHLKTHVNNLGDLKTHVDDLGALADALDDYIELAQSGAPTGDLRSLFEYFGLGLGLGLGLGPVYAEADRRGHAALENLIKDCQTFGLRQFDPKEAEDGDGDRDGDGDGDGGPS